MHMSSLLCILWLYPFTHKKSANFVPSNSIRHWSLQVPFIWQRKSVKQVTARVFTRRWCTSVWPHSWRKEERKQEEALLKTRNKMQWPHFKEFHHKESIRFSFLAYAVIVSSGLVMSVVVFSCSFLLPYKIYLTIAWSAHAFVPHVTCFWEMLRRKSDKIQPSNVTYLFPTTKRLYDDCTGKLVGRS